MKGSQTIGDTLKDLQICLRTMVRIIEDRENNQITAIEFNQQFQEAKERLRSICEEQLKVFAKTQHLLLEETPSISKLSSFADLKFFLSKLIEKIGF